MSRRQQRLGDVLELRYGKSLPDRERKPGGVPVYGSGGIGGGHDSALVQGPGVIVGRKGSVGSVFFEPADFFPIDTVYYAVPKEDKIDLRYAYYLLSSLPLASMNSDVAVPGLNRDRALSIEVQLPSKAEQYAIVSILSAYDDLIENNRRRMALLEESVRLLYQEWFVRLRFPGYEHTRIVDGVPDGWESCLLDDICKIGRGASPRPIMNFMGGSVPWFKIGDATASDCPFIFSTQELITEDGAKKSILLEPGSLILSNSATCGIPYFTGVSGCVHDGWLHFSNFRKVGKWFLYCYLLFKRAELVNSVSDGSTQKNLNTSAVGRLKVVLPKNQLLTSQFEGAVKVNFDAINILSRQNASLRAARDLLLPRLMSGEIVV
jgi:type I restriction enzyme S subunit